MNKHQDRSHVADVDGDGKKDLILISDNGVTVALQNSSGTLNQPTLWTDEFSAWRGWNNSHTYHFADVTGDGKVDIVGFGADNVTVAVNTGSSFISSIWHNDFGINDGWSANTLKMLADVNGDGRADIVGFGLNEITVCPSNGSNFTSSCAIWHNDFGHNDGWGAPVTPKLLADFNNDGKIDLVGVGINEWTINLSTGSSFSTYLGLQYRTY